MGRLFCFRGFFMIEICDHCQYPFSTSVKDLFPVCPLCGTENVRGAVIPRGRVIHETAMVAPSGNAMRFPVKAKARRVRKRKTNAVDSSRCSE